MKDPVLLRSPAEAAAFVHGLWRSDLFRSSEYIAGWVSRFAARPIAFAEMSDVERETPHFGTWFGMTYLRSYAEDVVSDLYYLHEIVHAVLLRYQPGTLFTSWYRRMNGIEMSASLETEGYAYLRIPGLRERSFADEIWADRYLGGQRRLGEGLLEIMRQDRYRAMQHPDPMDYCEQQIAAYARQNFQWAGCWKLPTGIDEARRPAYLHVEEHMAALHAGTLSLDEHLRWLRRWGEVPFPDQARLFAPIYWENKLSYQLRKL